MKWHNKYNWYVLEISIFTLLNILMIYIIGITNNYENLIFINLFIVFILGLATYRGANVISNEEITKVIRAPFTQEVYRDNKTIEEPKKDGLAGAIGSLIHCSSCTGVWVGAILIYSYLLFPNPTLAVSIILSLSAFERFLTTTYDLLKSYTK